MKRKCIAAIRMLAYESSADIIDKYNWIGESIAVGCSERFVRGMNEIYLAPKKETYLSILFLFTYFYFGKSLLLLLNQTIL
jgi:hypothetical protein